LKIYAQILLKDNSIVEKVIKNPSDKFEVEYFIDGEYQTFQYKFLKNYPYTLKTVLGSKKIIFYEHGSMTPLSPKFETNETILQDINKFSADKLLRALSDSAKRTGALDIKVVLGLAGMVALVLIVVLG